MVRSVRGALCGSCWCRSGYPPARLRSVLRLVPTGHTGGVGTSREKVFGRKRDASLIEPRSSGAAMLYLALNRNPFIPRAGICDSLHDAHISKAVVEIRMRLYPAL